MVFTAVAVVRLLQHQYVVECVDVLVLGVSVGCWSFYDTFSSTSKYLLV